MFEFIIASLGLIGISAVAFAYTYHKTGEYVFLAILGITILNLTLFKTMTLATPLFIAGIVTTCWFLYIMFKCKNNKARIAAIVGILLMISYIMIRNIYFPTFTLVGIGSLVLVPSALIYTLKCIVPVQKREEDKIWGDYYNRDTSQTP